MRDAARFIVSIAPGPGRELVDEVVSGGEELFWSDLAGLAESRGVRLPAVYRSRKVLTVDFDVLHFCLSMLSRATIVLRCLLNSVRRFS